MLGLSIHGGMRQRSYWLSQSSTGETTHREPVVEDAPAAEAAWIDDEGDVYGMEQR